MILHCWKGRSEAIEEKFGWHSPEHLATYAEDFVEGTCMLENGHEGEHEFTPDNEITIEFLPKGKP